MIISRHEAKGRSWRLGRRAISISCTEVAYLRSVNPNCSFNMQYRSGKAIKSVCSGFIALRRYFIHGPYLNKQKRNALSEWAAAEFRLISRAVSRQWDVCVNGKSIGVEFPSTHSRHTILALVARMGAHPRCSLHAALGALQQLPSDSSASQRILTFKVRTR